MSLCEIKTGFTARKSLSEAAATGGVKAIQLRDLREDLMVELSAASTYALEGDLGRYRVHAGDVLFRSRGDRNTAAVVSGSDDLSAVVILPLMILRPNTEVVDPGYLAWFINQPIAQRHFDGCARGTSMRMIPRPCLEKLRVAVPDLETQKRIAEVAQLVKRERALLEALAEKRETFTNFALLEQVRKAQPHGNGAGQLGARQISKAAGNSERTKL